jgi:hypothetical protein
VRIARILLIGIPAEPWRRKNCVHEPVRSNQEWHKGNADRLIAYGRACAKISSGTLFLFSLAHARFFFLVKKIFGRDENKISNKVHFFLVDFESDF